MAHAIDDTGEPTLDKEAAEHSIMIHGLKAVQSLAALLELEEPSYSVGSALRDEPVSTVITKLCEANRAHYYDEQRGVFVSGPDKQISWASNAWAIIAGVIEEKDLGRQALTIAYTQDGSVPGMTPYLHHYVRFNIQNRSQAAETHIGDLSCFLIRCARLFSKWA
jgi:alpha-L-rhamnosidase